MIESWVSNTSVYFPPAILHSEGRGNGSTKFTYGITSKGQWVREKPVASTLSVQLTQGQKYEEPAQGYRDEKERIPSVEPLLPH